ncbi:MAG TPA: prepilin peptidase [Opitutales bacterium]|nr:prepilin peptidase [Opitutales bacterium]
MTNAFRDINLWIPWYFPTIAFLFGACIGSFLNVCIYRIPAGKSVVRPGSHCGCGAPIRWYDNIPITSWFILRGKARCCGRPFSFRYPAIEALTGGLFLACFLTAPTIPAAFCWMLFAAFMVCATFIDLDTFTIPDRFSVGGMVIGVLLSACVPSLHSSDLFASPNISSLCEAVVGAFVGTALVYWIMVLAEIALRRPAMGEGDVKLMGAIGAFCGWQGAVFALFGGAILGTAAVVAWSLTRLILGKHLKSEIPPHAALPDDPSAAKPEDKKPADDSEDDVPEGAVPFGPALAGGALLYLLWAHPYMSAYMEQVSWILGGK